MSTGDRTSAGQAKAKPNVSPVRNIIGVVLLIAFSGAAILEFTANRGFNAATKSLTARLPDDTTESNSKNSEMPTKVEAEKLIGKAPDGPLVKMEGEQKATYSWQGLKKKYVIKAYYTNDKTPALRRFETQ